jgi:hypothetical protein
MGALANDGAVIVLDGNRRFPEASSSGAARPSSLTPSFQNEIRQKALAASRCRRNASSDLAKLGRFTLGIVLLEQCGRSEVPS